MNVRLIHGHDQKESRQVSSTLGNHTIKMDTFTELNWKGRQAPARRVTESTAVRSEGGYSLANLAQITRLQPAAV